MEHGSMDFPSYTNVFSSTYKQLNVKNEPLQLIAPQFETPLPQLQPSVGYNFMLLAPHMFIINS